MTLELISVLITDFLNKNTNTSRMKNFKNLGFLFALFAMAFLVSCGDDTGGGGTTDDNPVVDFSATMSEFTQEAGDTIYITAVATAGTNPMNTIQVNEDGVALPFERVLYDGVGATSNPRLLFDTEKDAFTFVVGVIVGTELATKSISVVVTDEEGFSTSTTVPVTTVGNPPVLSTTMMSGMLNREPSVLVGLPLTGVVGSGELSTLTVLEDDVAIADFDRIFWEGPNVTENPFSVGDTNKDGFAGISLQLRTADVEATREYEIILTDVNGLTSSYEFTIVTEIPGTPVEALMGEFFNFDGQLFGSYDFETNDNVPQSNTMSDIRDGGLDSNDNWRRVISPVNGASMRKLSGDNVFGNIVNKEELSGLFDAGTEFTGDVVATDDVFAVLTGEGNYVVFTITAIIETNNDNNDGYMIDIKR